MARVRCEPWYSIGMSSVQRSPDGMQHYFPPGPPKKRHWREDPLPWTLGRDLVLQTVDDEKGKGFGQIYLNSIDSLGNDD